MGNPGFNAIIWMSLLLLAGCDTSEMEGIQSARVTMGKNHQSAGVAMGTPIQSEPPGDYFIGRRYYKKDYKFWGYIRKPCESWRAAQLAVLNERQKLAPDRAANQIGSDNNYEYKLYGYFSKEGPVYEPASNGFYPEFVLTGYELRSISPAPIFHTAAATDPVRRVIGSPY